MSILRNPKVDKAIDALMDNPSVDALDNVIAEVAAENRPLSDYQYACESGELAAWEDEIGDHKDTAYDMTKAPCGCNPSFDTQCPEHSNEYPEHDEDPDTAPDAHLDDYGFDPDQEIPF